MMRTIEPLASWLMAAPERNVELRLLVLALLLLVTLGGAMLWLGRLLIEEKRERRRLEEALDASQQGRRAAEADTHRLAKKLEERQGSIDRLKRDLATQRKKTHEAREALAPLQEKVRTLEESLRDERRRTERLMRERERLAETPRDDAPRPGETARPATPTSSKELETRTKLLEDELRRTRDDLEHERGRAQELHAEVRRHKRLAERLRRVDVVNRGRMALLEDKLATARRQHYEAISELAALRGEVHPPRPTDLDEERPAHAEANVETADVAAREGTDEETGAPERANG